MSETQITVTLTPEQAATVASALGTQVDEYNKCGGFRGADECEQLEQIFSDAIRAAGFQFP